MTTESLQWPELYGFWIYGPGPSYVIYVEPGSISETAGIRVGDRIVELGAPYAPFPDELRRRYDTLVIVRDWQFRQGAQFQ